MDKKHVLHFYKHPGLSESHIQSLLSAVQLKHAGLTQIESEVCFNIATREKLNDKKVSQLKWLLSEVFDKENTSAKSALKCDDAFTFLIEVGPRLNVESPYSTNAVSICLAIGLTEVTRIEVSTRYLFHSTDQNIDVKSLKKFLSSLLFDKMTEMIYDYPIESFAVDTKPENVFDIKLMENGMEPLETFNIEYGLAFDKWDVDFYYNMFKLNLQRNPTNVELFDLAQSNSEHSRHWFFKGIMMHGGIAKDKTLMQLVMDTQLHTNNNNVIKYSDNSSAIKGFDIETLFPSDPTSSSLYIKKKMLRNILFTAETHNFPTGVAPFPGAATGTGGRIRDTHAAGRGSHVIAGTAGYCYGNLNIPDYSMPWEEEFVYPSNFASPLKIIIEASNGASDYGNKFGEPVICGFSRSFGLMKANKERCEWVKPIMFSAGIGAIEDDHILKRQPEKGMKVVKLGGPVYRIGVGGGAASSIQVQGDNTEELDFSAVQRGDAEMEQKLNRLIRACVEMGSSNPICSIHDQGAGGNGNVLKEICEPAGALIRTKDFQLGDPTLSVLEIWGAEYQESDAILIEENNVKVLQKLSEREKVSVCVVGEITGDGCIVLEDSSNHTASKNAVDLPLDVVLGNIPPKTFILEDPKDIFTELELPVGLTLMDMLERVLKLPSVASKRYLTNKVDRSVTGLIAQQQCVGPLHTPLADVAVVALSHFETVGGATAIGEQPIKCLLDAKKGARLSVAEAFTNLVFANITHIRDVKCSANWMWPAKETGEGIRLYDACEAMTEMFSNLGAGIDGGKDSLSMAARVDSKVVKSPGSLVISLYAPCKDVYKTVTPDLKATSSELVYVKMDSTKQWRLGGSALAHVYGQIGNEVPDIQNFKVFTDCFNLTQRLIEEESILSGHDVSDGGLITTLLEMCFAGNAGMKLTLDELLLLNVSRTNVDFLFGEEPALVLQISRDQVDKVVDQYKSNNIICVKLGTVLDNDDIIIQHASETLLQAKVDELRLLWEETSFQLEKLQCNPQCVEDEKICLSERTTPQYNMSFTPRITIETAIRPKVAVLREEGSNGDREMVSSLYMVGFDVYDVTMTDLCSSRVSLAEFKGLVFVGGFSYSDVFNSAKGWAAVCKMNPVASKELQAFHDRSDTFSLGVCNGCQLMALLGWVGNEDTADEKKPSQDDSAIANQGVCFKHNVSERFESRFVNVKIVENCAVMLKDMAGSTLGIWVAHGEGRPIFRNNDVYENIERGSLAPIRYVDDKGDITMKYPLNPNGATNGIAALCSKDGRHLAMMPHPERCTQMWQWPWVPSEWKSLRTSPWVKMFQNAYEWCTEK